jgi:hypothetical protein
MQLLPEHTVNYYSNFTFFLKKKKVLKILSLCGHLQTSNTRKTVATVSSESTDWRRNQSPRPVQHVVPVRGNSPSDHTTRTAPCCHWTGPSHARLTTSLQDPCSEQISTDESATQYRSLYATHSTTYFTQKRPMSLRATESERQKPWKNWILRTKYKEINMTRYS